MVGLLPSKPGIQPLIPQPSRVRAQSSCPCAASWLMTGVEGVDYPTPERSATFFQHQPASYMAAATQRRCWGSGDPPQSLRKTHPWLSQRCFPHTNLHSQWGRSREGLCLGQVNSGKNLKDHPWDGTGRLMLSWITL